MNNAEAEDVVEHIKAWIVDRDEFIKDANETVGKVNIISIPNAEATIRDETKDFFY